MIRPLQVPPALALLTLLGCQKDTIHSVTQDMAARVAATRVPEGIQVSNQGEERVGFVVWNRDWFAFFAPCIDPGSECLRLAPGQSVLVRTTEIQGYSPGAREAVVYWWRIEPDGTGGYRLAELNEILIPLD
jgi:hypothetical protein